MLLLAVAVSWLGFVLHNVADLPGQTLWSPETLYPTAVLVLFLAVAPIRRWLLLGWAVLHLVGGGIISVLPLPFLPFDPVQTLHHYSFHVLYALTQIPLLILTLRAPEPANPRH